MTDDGRRGLLMTWACMAGTMRRMGVLDRSKEVEGAVSGCGRLAYM